MIQRWRLSLPPFETRVFSVLYIPLQFPRGRCSAVLSALPKKQNISSGKEISLSVDADLRLRISDDLSLLDESV
ncbi:hypothetical protein L1887_11653 [Cichorium endivia]|nr:hypothetical protein L1887_11653 [Cichorium endivia]